MIQAFVESGHDGNRIKRFFRQGEINTLLKNCRTGLHQAQEVFKVGNIMTFRMIAVSKIGKAEY
jgi:hypothetical protein